LPHTAAALLYAAAHTFGRKNESQRGEGWRVARDLRTHENAP